LTHRLSYSGAPKMLAWIANQMSQRGHEVHVISYFTSEQMQQLDEKVIFHCLQVKQNRSRLVRNSVEMARVQYKLLKILNHLAPDMIVAFSISGSFVFLGLNRMFGKHKVIISERADPYAYRGIIARIRFKLMGCADGVVFQTEGAQTFYNGKNEKIRKVSVVIPNPVIIKDVVKQNISHFQFAFENRDNRVVTVGRLSLAQKRQDVLLEAFAIVRKTYPELTLTIYGDGTDKEKIQVLINRLGLDDCVKLAGVTSNVEEEICSARVFVLTSDFEGIPNALIEALSIGVPCVSTKCSPGGAEVLIKDGENGFLVPCGDTLALADRILELVQNKNVSGRFSKEGPKIAEKFSKEKIADMWEEYIFIIANRQG